MNRISQADMGSQFTVQINDVTLEPGRVIGGRYKLTDHLGQGGFAQVFEAHDTRIERDVAIKCLNLHSKHTERMGETIIERFEREAKLAAQISHPGVVNIFDYGVLGQSESVPYIVMELLDGWDLDEELSKNGPLPPERALPLFVTCLEALGRAHRKGIVHKDLKPANLFLANPNERDEALRVVDFGIAHMRTAVENRLTSTGEILGTPQYLAPEYIERQDVSPRLDVYQMGLVLVEALTAKPAVYRDHHLLTLQAHSTGDIDVPITLMDSELAPVLLRSMALRPSERYEDGLEFADALAEVDPEKVPAVPRGAPKRKLSGATAMSSERAGAATVPVSARSNSTGDASDDTNKVLYVLVAGLAGAVLLAGIAAYSLMTQDDAEPPAAEAEAASEVVDDGAATQKESATDESEAKTEDQQASESSDAKKQAEKTSESKESAAGEPEPKRQEEASKPAEKPPRRVESDKRGRSDDRDRPGKGKGRDKRRNRPAEDFKEAADRLKKGTENAKETAKEVDRILKGLGGK
jgi:serine/threonine protein kinase